MRDLIIARLNQILIDSDYELEDPSNAEEETFITSIEEIEAMSDTELLEFFEFTAGFQG